ncbi:hypothetical protein ESCO_004873 [Escovopsis weberi]|uniref:Pre-mRNA splicing factor CLF1 n=1 Tax=Escovopsis weberi TaxID=150374 RepID=A0A0M8MYE2_ESCWE|nr:hypothetical protein ESCO_004873 [Escovopsis weberi]
MSPPKPATSLDGSCSVIHDNTLYSFSPQGFQSLRLEEGAEWKELAIGEKVTGATCTGTTPADDDHAALFVVGGSSDSADYTGLQKYTYSTGKWTTIRPSDLVTKNRLWHGSTYIKDYDVIFVYAGSQDGLAGLSSQTFTINASEPYGVRGYESDAPVSSPILLDWSSDNAAIMSGDGTSGQLYLFNPGQGWRDSGAGLAQPVNKASGSMDVVLTKGTDGSKSIYTFDFSQLPNHVSRAVVQDASGRLVANATAIKKRSAAGQESPAQRDLTVDNWPTYNSTLAPTATRKGFAVAQGADGLAVFSGGNAKDPLAMFDANNNHWLNATELFLGPKMKVAFEKIIPPSSSSSTTSPPTTSATITPEPAITSPTSSPHPTDLSVPPMQTSDSDDSGITVNDILGITLGTISGFLALLGLIAFIMSIRRRRRLRKGRLGNRRIGSPIPIEKDPDFASDPAQSPPPDYYPRHRNQPSEDSASSVAILLGRGGQQKPPAKAGAGQPRAASPSVTKPHNVAISKPIPQANSNPLLQVEDDKGLISRPVVLGSQSSPATLAPPNVQAPSGNRGAPPAQAAPGISVVPENGESDDETRRSSGWNGYWSSGSALSILGFGASKRNTLTSEDPSSRYSQATGDQRELHNSAKVPPLTVQARRVTSKSPVVSTPTGSAVWKEGLSVSIENRPFSGASSMYSSGVPESVHEAWDPSLAKKAWGTDRAPSIAYALRSNTSLTPHASGMSRQPQLAMATTSTDMSWLNLGEEGRR